MSSIKEIAPEGNKKDNLWEKKNSNVFSEKKTSSQVKCPYKLENWNGKKFP